MASGHNDATLTRSISDLSLQYSQSQHPFLPPPATHSRKTRAHSVPPFYFLSPQHEHYITSTLNGDQWRPPIEIVDTASKKRRFVLLPSYIDKHKSDRGDAVVKPTPTQQKIQILIHYSHGLRWILCGVGSSRHKKQLSEPSLCRIDMQCRLEIGDICTCRRHVADIAG